MPWMAATHRAAAAVVVYRCPYTCEHTVLGWDAESCPAFFAHVSAATRPAPDGRALQVYLAATFQK